MTDILKNSRCSVSTEQSGATSGRSQAERSEATRRKVMDAALRILRERGYAGFRTEAVAVAAGTSRGAMLHHFPKKRDLIISAYEYLFDRLVQTSLARGREVSDFNELFDGLIEDARDFFLGEHFLAVIDILVSAANERDLRKDILAISRKNRLPVEHAWIESMCVYLPRDVAEDVVFMTFNLFRGFATRTFLEDDRRKFDHITKVWKEMVLERLGRDIRASTNGAGARDERSNRHSKTKTGARSIKQKPGRDK